MFKEEFFNELTKINHRYHFNGALAMLTPAETLFQDTLGWGNFEQHDPFTKQTVTGLGSLTKQFTATAILQLVEMNLIGLDQPLASYVSGYKYGNKITIRQLLNMDSGIPDYTDIIVAKLTETAKQQDMTLNATEIMINKALGEDIPFDQILNLINEQVLDFTPGSQFAYSNTNYALLTVIIERVASSSYTSYIQKHILSPLSMTHTVNGTAYSNVDSYLYQGSQIINLGKGNHQLGDGSLVTNLVDLKLWARAVMTGQLLSPTSQDLCFKLQHGKYGMGWMKLNSWYWHSGQILGYWSDFFLSPKHDLAMVWLYNISPIGEDEQAWLKATDDWRERFLRAFTNEP